MRTIILASGDICQVSDEDYDYLINFDRRLCGTRGGGYPARRVYINGKQHNIWMHHVILERKGEIVPSGMVVDHKDRDHLNNQRDNLRIVTKSVNRHNMKTQQNNTSGERGVVKTKKETWLA